MAGYPCCCELVPQPCCPDNPPPTTLCAYYTSPCFLFNDIVFPITFIKNEAGSGFTGWKGTYQKSIAGGLLFARVRLFCGPPWQFAGGTFTPEWNTGIGWVKKDWPYIFCPWWTDPTEGGKCPVGGGEFSNVSCTQNPNGTTTYWPTWCRTCPMGYAHNACVGFICICQPCTAGLQANHGGHSGAGDADSVVCDPLEIAKTKLMTGNTSAAATANCGTGPLPCTGDTTPVTLTVRQCPAEGLTAEGISQFERSGSILVPEGINEIQRAKPKMTIDQMAIARKACAEQKAKGLPCTAFN